MVLTTTTIIIIVVVIIIIISSSSSIRKLSPVTCVEIFDLFGYCDLDLDPMAVIYGTSRNYYICLNVCILFNRNRTLAATRHVSYGSKYPKCVLRPRSGSERIVGAF